MHRPKARGAAVLTTWASWGQLYKCGHVDPNQLGEPQRVGVTPNLLGWPQLVGVTLTCWGGVVHLGPPSSPTRRGWTSSGSEVDRHGTVSVHFWTTSTSVHPRSTSVTYLVIAASTPRLFGFACFTNGRLRGRRLRGRRSLPTRLHYATIYATVGPNRGACRRAARCTGLQRWRAHPHAP